MIYLRFAANGTNPILVRQVSLEWQFANCETVTFMFNNEVFAENIIHKRIYLTGLGLKDLFSEFQISLVGMFFQRSFFVAFILELLIDPSLYEI